MPRTITHELKLQNAREPFVAFLSQTDGLAEKRGPILVQLPPSLSFDAAVVTAFLERRARHVRRARRLRAEACDVVLAAGELALDRVPNLTSGGRSATGAGSRRAGGLAAASPIFGCTAHHGSTGRDTTSIYIATLAATVRSIPTAEEVWCVFDNTASGAAIENAWELRERRHRRTAWLSRGDGIGVFASAARVCRHGRCAVALLSAASRRRRAVGCVAESRGLQVARCSLVAWLRWRRSMDRGRVWAHFP